MKETKFDFNMKRTAFILFCLLQSFAFLQAEIPVGYYYLAKNKSGAELKTALHEIVSQCKTLSYGGGEAETTWCGFYETDRNAHDNSVIDRYSAETFYFSSACVAVEGMHIEHSLPKSWWGALENNAYRDLHHLFPAEGQINSTKNNLPLGEVAKATYDNGVSKVGNNVFGTTYTGKCFEPADEYKGDFARAYLYVSTAYENLSERWTSPMMNNETYPVWNDWALRLLLSWHRGDPVSTLERERMERVYALQGNRNPFVDFPDLVEHVWGNRSASAFGFPNETEAFLVTPNRWTTVDFGAILKGGTCRYALDFKGVNLTSDVAMSFLQNNQGFSVTISSKQTQNELTTATIEIAFSGAETGLFADTLRLSGGGLSGEVLVPLSVVVSSDFVALEPTEVTATTAVLNWMEYSAAENYLVDLYQGDTEAGDLFFSTYIEGDGWNKVLEIYNGTGQNVDLSKYSLRKQNNGIGAFAYDFPLSGVLRSGETFVIAHGSATAESLLSKIDLQTTSHYEDIMAFNGNDAMALYREGTLIDVVGVENMPEVWGENLCLRRKTSVTQPNVQFDINEWTTENYDSYSSLKTFSAEFASARNYILQQQSVGNVTAYQVTGLQPLAKYSYRVWACHDGNCEPSENAKALRTADLGAPLALDATDVTANSFVANWEPNADATSYQLTAFCLKGAGTVTYTEGFDNLGTNGKPLPDSWTGTISGNYTTAANSGAATPSAAFKNSGEYLQTPTFGAPITALSFMAKYNSGGAGSNLLVEALSDGNFTPIDTFEYADNSKQTFSYAFDTEKDYRAIRFTYNKVKGNVALDDVAITYGSLDTLYVLKNEAVTTTQFLVSGLTNETDYFYFVQMVNGATLSDVSNVIKVTTTTQSPSNVELVNCNENQPKIYSISPNTICIEQATEPITVFNLLGNVVALSNATTAQISVPCSGIYIVSVGTRSYKVSVF